MRIAILPEGQQDFSHYACQSFQINENKVLLKVFLQITYAAYHNQNVASKK